MVLVSAVNPSSLCQCPRGPPPTAALCSHPDNPPAPEPRLRMPWRHGSPPSSRRPPIPRGRLGLHLPRGGPGRGRRAKWGGASWPSFGQRAAWARPRRRRGFLCSPGHVLEDGAELSGELRMPGLVCDLVRAEVCRVGDGDVKAPVEELLDDRDTVMSEGGGCGGG